MHCCDGQNPKTRISDPDAFVYLSADSDPGGVQLHGGHPDRCHPRLFHEELCDTVHDGGTDGHDQGYPAPGAGIRPDRDDPGDNGRHRGFLFGKADVEAWKKRALGEMGDNLS